MEALLEINKYLRPLNSVAIFDPAIATRNAGDEIISDAARRQIRRVLPSAFQATIPTHERIFTRSYRFCTQADSKIIAGSNILTANMLTDRQWRLRPWDLPFVKDLIGLGVGWRHYNQPRNKLSDVMMRRVLSKTGWHSARDEHTRQELIKRGVKNVLNTACVTMWDLDLPKLQNLPLVKSKRAVTTVNIGRKSQDDSSFLELLCGEYEEVFIWPQGIDDEPYVDLLMKKNPKLKRLGPTLAAYDELLASSDGIDFVGNRLHAGIRALQHGRRALILSVDNRASEIARDTNLPVLSMSDGIEMVRKGINQPRPIEITLPVEAIEKWRAQFERRVEAGGIDVT